METRGAELVVLVSFILLNGMENPEPYYQYNDYLRRLFSSNHSYPLKNPPYISKMNYDMTGLFPFSLHSSYLRVARIYTPTTVTLLCATSTLDYIIAASRHLQWSIINRYSTFLSFFWIVINSVNLFPVILCINKCNQLDLLLRSSFPLT